MNHEEEKNRMRDEHPTCVWCEQWVTDDATATFEVVGTGHKVDLPIHGRCVEALAAKHARITARVEDRDVG